jgi:hypothetical protein
MANPSQPVFDIYVSLACVVVLAIIVAIIGVVIHKRAAADKDTTPEAPFSLTELRRLRAEGHISDDEYDRVRAKMIGESMTALETDNGGSASTPDGRTESDEGTG